MSQIITKICDRCKHELSSSEFTNAMALDFRGVEIKIITHESRWGNTIYRVGWKGELCDRCHVIVVDVLAETFEKAMFGEKAPEPELPVARVHRRTKRSSKL